MTRRPRRTPGPCPDRPVVLTFGAGKLHLTLVHRGDEIAVNVDHDDESDQLCQLTLEAEHSDEPAAVRFYNNADDESEEIYP